MKIFLRLASAILFFSFPVHAQFTEFHPELDWYTIKGENVDVHYHAGTERTANVVLKIMNEIWGPVTSLYQYSPERVHFVIKDLDDYSNGATYFFDNKIEIWSSSLDFDLRGSHNWLRNVISHEFTHMVQIQAALKTTRRIPAVYLQWLNYEDERRPDILYGFPNVIVSYPLAFLNMPAWLAEGTAQYMRQEFDYDNWDAHRDMILRSYALDGNMLTWNQMGVFDKTSLGNESVYNSGFALSRYIAQKYGEDKLRQITRRLATLTNFTVDAAFSDALGKDGKTVYSEWSSFLKSDYNKRIAPVRAAYISGDTLAKEGFGNFYPVFTDSGKKFLYVSNKSSDYFSPSSLYWYDIAAKKETLVLSGIRSTVSLLPGSNKIIYSRLTDDNPGWYNVHDLFSYDVVTKEEKRLSNNIRANYPFVSPDGSSIAFIFQKDGTSNIGIVDTSGKDFRQLTFYTDGEQVFNPKFSPDGKAIIFDYSYHHGRDIAQVPVAGGAVAWLLKTDADERNAVFTSLTEIIYASDETGIFNLYRLNVHTGAKVQVTNVLGGAFYPSVAPDGSIVYAGYTSAGYKIMYLPAAAQVTVPENAAYIRTKYPPLDTRVPIGDVPDTLAFALRHFKDKSLTPAPAEKYSGAFSKITFFPFVRLDNYNTSNKFTEKLKPGVYLASSDMLNRYAFFAGASVNSRMERDLFLMFEYKNKLPVLYGLGLKPELALELFNVSRKTNVDILIDEYPAVGTSVTYNLFEVGINARHRFISRGQNLSFRYAFSRYSAEIGGFIFPGTNLLYPTSSDPYLLSGNFEVKYNLEAESPYIDSDVNPLKTDLEIKYNYELNKFNPDGEYSVDNGILVPLYKNYDFHRLEANISHAFRLGAKQAIGIKLRAGGILGKTVPDFFDFYLGGLVGMKGYPFYAINGNSLVWGQINYRFPLFTGIDGRVGHLYFDKIFGIIYADFGSAWTGKFNQIGKIRKDVGGELRFALSSFYLFPTSVFFNASYGLDAFTKTARGKVINYGHEWRFYAGVLFDFEF